MKRQSQSREVGRSMMVNIVGAKHYARELLQQIIFFVGGARRADYANCLPAIAISNLAETATNQFECLLP